MKLLALLLLLTGVQSQPQSQSEPPRQCPAPRLDINAASKEQLITLEGITPEIADALIKARPLRSTREVQVRMPKEVWEKVHFKFCFPNGIQIISGNRIETLQFEARPKEEMKPAEQPAEQRLPKETVEERFRRLLEEAEKGAKAPLPEK